MKNQFALNSNRLSALLFCITVLFLACAGVVASAESGGATWYAPQQTPPAEKTVEQVQKNIQVLTGLPHYPRWILPVRIFGEHAVKLLLI